MYSRHYHCLWEALVARSTYIYLLMDKADWDMPVAAFTVKWEMESWIINNPGTYVRLRMRDGLYPDRTGKQPVGMGGRE